MSFLKIDSFVFGCSFSLQTNPFKILSSSGKSEGGYVLPSDVFKYFMVVICPFLSVNSILLEISFVMVSMLSVSSFLSSVTTACQQLSLP